jgi:hypothetical protein
MVAVAVAAGAGVTVGEGVAVVMKGRGAPRAMARRITATASASVTHQMVRRDSTMRPIVLLRRTLFLFLRRGSLILDPSPSLAES